MKRHIPFFFFILLFVLTNVSGYSQPMTPIKVDALMVEKVKEDVWVPFMESYRDLAIEQFTSIYTPDVIRVSKDLNTIETGEEYFKNISTFFEQIKNAGLEMRITFSVVSTAMGDDKVYQTGYYTIGLRKNDTDPFRSSGYSHFDVMMVEDKDGSWKISFDTDKQVKITDEEFLKSGDIYQLK